MRLQFMMFPAALVAAMPAQAEDYLTIEEAQNLLFPSATFAPADMTLSESQMEELLSSVDAPIFRSKVRAWKVSTGGWFILDQVMGRDDRVTYAIGLDQDGTVRGIEILVCVAGYDGIRRPGWRSQFVGKKSPNFNDIASISGATLSAMHIAEGVKRTLVTYIKYIAPQSG